MFFDVCAQALQERLPVGPISPYMCTTVALLTQDLTGYFLKHSFGRHLLSAHISSLSPIYPTVNACTCVLWSKEKLDELSTS